MSIQDIPIPPAISAANLYIEDRRKLKRAAVDYFAVRRAMGVQCGKNTPVLCVKFLYWPAPIRKHVVEVARINTEQILNIILAVRGIRLKTREA